MIKGKDISTMFTKEENKKNGRLGYCRLPEKKILSLVLHSMERSCRKEAENEEISICDGNT